MGPFKVLTCTWNARLERWMPWSDVRFTDGTRKFIPTEWCEIEGQEQTCKFKFLSILGMVFGLALVFVLHDYILSVLDDAYNLIITWSNLNGR